MYKSITNDVYGKNMTRQEAESKAQAKKRKKGWFGKNQVENKVIGDMSNTPTQVNEDLHQMQKPAGGQNG